NPRWTGRWSASCLWHGHNVGLLHRGALAFHSAHSLVVSSRCNRTYCRHRRNTARGTWGATLSRICSCRRFRTAQFSVGRHHHSGGHGVPHGMGQKSLAAFSDFLRTVRWFCGLNHFWCTHLESATPVPERASPWHSTSGCGGNVIQPAFAGSLSDY